MIEVLVALVMAVILVSTTCSSLITSLRAEQSTAQLREGALLVTQTATRSLLGFNEGDVATGLGAGWEASAEDVTEGGPDLSTEWRVWLLSPEGGVPLRMALRTHARR